MRTRFALVFLAMLPAVPQTGPVVQFPSPSPGRPGEAVPMSRFRPANNQPYQPTAEEKSQIQAKMAQLGKMVEQLKYNRAEPALLPDIEIYLSAAQWIVEFPDEFFNQGSVAATLAVLDEGIERARQMQEGRRPWVTAKGRVERGYRSRVDGSVQPYRVIVPESYDGSRPVPLCVNLHGRAVTTYEVNFLRATATARNLPGPPADDWLQLDVYGRGNNTYQWPGETDVFEAMASVESRYKVDPERIALKGFSMGGAGVWHIGLHYPDLWASIEAGAGDTRSQRYAVQEQMAPHQQAMSRILDYMFEWALNATNTPFVAYVGEIDGGFAKHIAVKEQLVREGIHFQGDLFGGYDSVEVPAIRFLVAERTPHRTPPEYRKLLDAFHREYVTRGRRSPDRVRFVTYTTRYNRAHWVTVDGLARHYKRADVDAQRTDNRARYDITTRNVTRLILRETERASTIHIDGQQLNVKPAPQIFLLNSNGRWQVNGASDTVLRKKHGLQGPIDDAFLDSFLIVRPTGTPWNKAAHDQAMQILRAFDRHYRLAYRGRIPMKDDNNVTEADFARSNVVLFGDPGSNLWLGKMNGKLPVNWTKETVVFGGRSFPAAEFVPVLIYPNPMNAAKYVVVNSGLTADWQDWAGDHPMPELGDFAVLKVKEGSEQPAVAMAGLFDESWKLPLDLAQGPATSSAREIAEWVIRWEGRVMIEGISRPITTLSQIPPGDFKIVGIDLTGAAMVPSELEKLAGLTTLRELYLPGPVWNPGGGREDANDVLKSIATLKNLEKLYFGWHFSSQINVKDAGIKHLLALTQLTNFRCAQCRITKISLAPLTRLRSLDLSYTPFTDAGLAGLAGLKQLRRLLLRDTMVTDEGLKHLAGLTQLEELDLSGTHVSDAGIEYLRKMTAMRKLNLLGARATDASIGVLAGMKRLQVVNLYRSQITNTGLARLQQLKELTDIDLRYTRATPNGIESLRVALPKSKVQFAGSAVVHANATRTARPAGNTAQAIAEWVHALGGTAALTAGRLQAVDLSSTSVSDAQLSYLSGLAGLEKLNLDATQIGDLGLASIEHLNGLRELNLSNTTVSDAGLSKLAGLTQLKSLKIAGTLVEGRGLGFLSRLTRLHELDLANSRVNDEALPYVAKVSSLERLVLSHTDVTDNGMKQLTGLAELQVLDLAGSDIGDAGLEHIAALTNLRELNLNYARFTDKGLEALKPLQKLERIEMTRTRATDAGVEALAALPNLAEIKLDYTAIDDKALASLEGHRAIRALSLDSTGVTDNGATLLKTMAGLKSLNLYHTLVTEKGVQGLKSALPSCEIVFDRDSALPNRRSTLR